MCRVAFIGAGRMARQHMLAFRDIAGVKLAGIYSRTRTRANALAHEFDIPVVCGSVDELYERAEADLVVVSVSILSMNEVCRACFDHPWTALVEKPAGYNVADAQAIEMVARARMRRAYVALNRRQYGSTRVVLQDLATQSGPRLITVQDQEDAIAALASGQPKLVVDNWMYANSIHLIDLFTVFGRGTVTEVVPVIQWNPQHRHYAAAKIGFDSGDVGLYQAVWDAPGPWAVTVTAPAKRWEMRPVEHASYQIAGTRTLETVAVEAWDSQFKPGLRRQAELAVLAASGTQTELPTLQDALVSMRLTQAIYAERPTGDIA